MAPLDNLHRYRLPIDQTYPILDLQDCISDLDSVIAIGEVLEEQAKEEGTFNFELWHALVITYGRGFQPGKSHQRGCQHAGLRQFLPALDAEQRRYHEALMDVRNTQVAHNVATGGGAVTVSFDSSGTFAGIDGFQTSGGVSTAEARKAISVSRALLALAWQERERLIDELAHQWSERTLTADELAEAVKQREAFVARVRSEGDGKT